MKKYKKASKNRSIVVWLALFFSLNIIGVSYAYWNDGIHVDVRIRSGYLNPLFVESQVIDDSNQSDCIMVDVTEDSIELKGIADKDLQKRYEFSLFNDGTVPYKIKEIINIADSSISYINFVDDKILLNIDTNMDTDYSSDEIRNYYFMYQVLLTMPTGKWHKKLQIEGEISIMPVSKDDDISIIEDVQEECIDKVMEEYE